MVQKAEKKKKKSTTEKQEEKFHERKKEISRKTQMTNRGKTKGKINTIDMD